MDWPEDHPHNLTKRTSSVSTNTSVGQNPLGYYTEMQYILLGDLREVLEGGPTLAERNWLLTILDALLETLPTQFDLKEEGGYLSEVLEAFPYWEPQVEELRREHGPLCESLQTLRDRVFTGSEYKQVAQVVRDDLRDWMERLTHHDSVECRLFQDAVNLEVGVGD